jgi:sugar/nucleoside kinase (ribokinase family)
MPPRPAVVLGEALVDLLEQPGGALHPMVGGAPLNVAVALARLGTPSRLITAVGSDAFGDRIRDLLAESGVDISGVRTAPGPTPLAVATFRGAEPSFAFYGDPPAYARTTASDVDESAVAEAPVIYAGSIALATDMFDAVQKAWAVDGPVRVLDPNLRPFVMADPAAAVRVQRRVEELAATADLVKLSDVDARLLYGAVAPSAAALRLRALGAGSVMVTLGAAGALLLRPDRGERPADLLETVIHRTDRVYALPAAPGPVVDTTGCGDSVTAAMMHRLARGLADDAEWLEAAGFALKVAAHVAARPGGATAMPYASELL